VLHLAMSLTLHFCNERIMCVPAPGRLDFVPDRIERHYLFFFVQ
jgi:hypothetical protein